jgi:GxxExxY protein
MEEIGGPYDFCGQILGLAMNVHSTLGRGFLESVYQNALTIELRRAGIQFEVNKAITVRYDGEIGGSFVADMFVNECLILELKAISTLAKIHEVQLVNYLTATSLDEGLLLNFGAARLEYKKKFRTAKRTPFHSDDQPFCKFCTFCLRRAVR